ncbi:MAG: hypothetical protein HC894_29545 [Microcoleus sp. SM1_3_4]|nr:hypothetical protein [Microcoleus sp. SM1_3_4]
MTLPKRPKVFRTQPGRRIKYPLRTLCCQLSTVNCQLFKNTRQSAIDL